MTRVDSTVRDLYERHAGDFDRDRDRSLFERVWLDRFVRYLPSTAAVLDIGCGMGEPIARNLIERGFAVVGVDSSPSMIAMCRGRFPDAEWFVADMRQLTLGRKFAGILAWDSFFHLHVDEQRPMFKRFAAHATPGAPLMFTSGVSEGEAIGSYCGEPCITRAWTLRNTNSYSRTTGLPSAPTSGKTLNVAGTPVWLATCGAP